MTPEPPDIRTPPPGGTPNDHLVSGGAAGQVPPASHAAATRSADRSTGGRSGRWLIEWVAILVVALAFAFVIRTFVVQTFYIPSGSMLPTLQIGDRILVDKLSYKLHAIHRGDIVVFKRPPLEQANYSDLVKRVIGLPGETISSVGGQVYIDGRPLSEPWLKTPVPSLPSPVNQPFNLRQPYTIPPNEYFVMGDNRTNSEDSRWFGPISKSLVVGKMLTIIWPPSHGALIGFGVLVGVVVIAILLYIVGSVRSSRRSSAASRRPPPTGAPGP